MYQIIQYIKFLISSTNHHGVHSPFVYNLVTKCFYNQTKLKDYKALDYYRKALLKNKSSIEITDFGSGSRVFNSNQRLISKMVKTSGTPVKRAELLYRIVDYFKPSELLELGTSLGIATQALALGNPEGKVTSIEGCPNTFELAKTQLIEFHLNNIILINETFETSIEKLNHKKYDLIFFDGNHNKDATLNYFNDLLDTIHNDSLFIFDDIHWSRGMTEAWETIKKHSAVTVTVDTFFWGLVFFRKEQPKQHFKIRV